MWLLLGSHDVWEAVLCKTTVRAGGPGVLDSGPTGSPGPAPPAAHRSPAALAQFCGQRQGTLQKETALREKTGETSDGEGTYGSFLSQAL